MRFFVLIALTIFLSLGFVYLSQINQQQPELLSANDDRLERMMNFCAARNPDLSKDQCRCIFTKSLYTDISNVELYDFYDDAFASHSPEKITTFNELKSACTS